MAKSTKEDRNKIVKEFNLKHYPQSKYFPVGFDLWLSNKNELAISSFQRGAEKDSCVGCMFFYQYLQGSCKSHNNKMVHLIIPWAIEASIRGHTDSMNVIIHQCYDLVTPQPAAGVSQFWENMQLELDITNTVPDERRKDVKKMITTDVCFVCSKEQSSTDYDDNNDNVILEKCGICKIYFYCGKDCQTYHWKKGKHMNECRHLSLLRKYCKPQYIKEIREAIIRGDDPKNIDRLQTIRTQLGLNRPVEEYKELVSRLATNNSSDDRRSPNRYKYLVARKDGTVNIGSTPKLI